MSVALMILGIWLVCVVHLVYRRDEMERWCRESGLIECLPPHAARAVFLLSWTMWLVFAIPLTLIALYDLVRWLAQRGGHGETDGAPDAAAAPADPADR